jgi:lysophospholipase
MTNIFQNDVTLRMAKLLKEEAILGTETKILVVYTGGTIGMVHSENGYIPQKSIFISTLRSNPRFHDSYEYERRLCDKNFKSDYLITPISFYGKRIIYTIIEMDPLLDSSCMNANNWVTIAQVVEEKYHFYDGFVILHGTDTMPYTASILSFLFENLQKPVIITGSQVPMGEVRTDAVDNLLGAITIAGHFDIPEVTLYFDNKLFRGNRTIKQDNSSFRAFQSPNMQPLVKAGISFKVNWSLVRRGFAEGRFNVHKTLDMNINTIYFFPGISIEAVVKALEPPTKAVILLTYGAGNIPDNRRDILNALKSANQRGVVLVNVSQCRIGGVADTYHTGKILRGCGVVSAVDMTFECALCKLAYLIGKGYSSNEVKHLIGENLRGELTQNKHEIRFSYTSKVLSENIAQALGVYTKLEEKIIEDAFFPVIACSSVKEGSTSVLTSLVEQGVSLSKPDYDNRTPLHIACTYGNLEAVRYLLRNNVAVNSIDNNGVTPLHEAIKREYYEVVDLLHNVGGEIRGTSEIVASLLCK